MGSQRVIVTGCQGQLGLALCRQLEADPAVALVGAVDLPEVDIADEAAVARLIDESKPDLVFNAAAFTHVDRCEREPAVAWRANAEAPEVLARACVAAGSGLVHVSTDYVFPGDGETPYREDDDPSPRSQYGRSKLEGERRVQAASPDFLVVRTSWVFGQGRNFVLAILEQAEKRRSGEADGPLRVVADQWGRPTYAWDLAEGLRRLLEAGGRGLYHLAGGGIATWWDLARASLDEAGHPDLVVERIATSDLQLDAPRPAFSVLDCSRAEALGVGLRDWREALRAYLEQVSQTQ